MRIVERYRAWALRAARGFMVFGVLLEAAYAFGACDVPHYRTAWSHQDSQGVLLKISLRQEDFAPKRLICLAGALKQKYAGRSVFANIFNSYEAARGWIPAIERTDYTIACQSHMHGFYSYDKEKREEYLLIDPDAFAQEVDSPFTTRIDLPFTGTPVCKLAINGRCLLEFFPIEPPFGDRPDVAGWVTLTASLGRNGFVSNVTVAGANAEPPEGKAALVDRAGGNLRTWRFEPAPHTDGLRITYRFEPSKTANRPTEVRFALPDEVSIRY